MEAFKAELVHEIFKLVWSSRALRDEDEVQVNEVGTKKYKSTTANLNALKLSCELLRLFVVEAIERAGIVAEAEGSEKIEPTHMERMLPQFMLDF